MGEQHLRATATASARRYNGPAIAMPVSRADPSQLYQALLLDPIYHYHAINVERVTFVDATSGCAGSFAYAKSIRSLAEGHSFVPCETAVWWLICAVPGSVILVVNNLSGAAPAGLD